MSVKRKVTVPLGKSAICACSSTVSAPASPGALRGDYAPVSVPLRAPDGGRMATSSFTSTRGALARVCLPLALLALAFAPSAANATGSAATDIYLTNGGHPFAGDNRLLTTITPNGDG